MCLNEDAKIVKATHISTLLLSFFIPGYYFPYPTRVLYLHGHLRLKLDKSRILLRVFCLQCTWEIKTAHHDLRVDASAPTMIESNGK